MRSAGRIAGDDAGACGPRHQPEAQTFGLLLDVGALPAESSSTGHPGHNDVSSTLSTSTWPTSRHLLCLTATFASNWESG
jgi:hypothetical protein